MSDEEIVTLLETGVGIRSVVIKSETALWLMPFRPRTEEEKWESMRWR